MEYVPVPLLFRACSTVFVFVEGSSTHLGSLLTSFVLFGVTLLALFWYRKPLISVPESVKHLQTTADTPRQNYSSFLSQERKLAVGNFDKTTRAKNKRSTMWQRRRCKQQRWGSSHPCASEGINGIGGISQRTAI